MSDRWSWIPRLIGIVALALVVVTATAPGAEGKRKKKKARSVEIAYSEPAVGAAGVGVCFPGSSCVMTEPLPGETHVSIEIEDDLGLPVHASVIQDTNGDGSWLAVDDYTVHICGSTAEPIEIEPDLTVTVWVWRGPGAPPPCAGVASSGTVKATFSKAR